MKTKKFIFTVTLALSSLLIMNSCSKIEEEYPAQDSQEIQLNLKSIPENPNNKVAYYAFDATPTGGQEKLPLTTFTDNANIVVMFEGTVWEIADSVNYGSSSAYILTINGGPYKYYGEIIRDMKILQSRGIKVLWNVDDAYSWNTATPFTTYDGQALNATQFAEFVRTMVVDKLGLDGISLDVEHMGSTAANAYFIELVKAFGAHFGPRSSNPDNTIYTAAIYSGGEAGYAIGQSPDVASYMNFVMDMGYFQDNTTRFYRWADYIGAGKTMIGVSNQYNSLSNATTAAAWEPTNGTKAGIMVFAANVNKPYTDAIFDAIPTPSIPGSPTNPDPADNATGVITTPTLSWTSGSGATTHQVYFGTSSSPSYIGDQTGTSYSPGELLANTTYYWRIDEQNSIGTTTGTVWNFTTGTGTGGLSVPLSSYFDANYGISTDGSNFSSTGGFDSEGYSFSYNLLGSSITWNNASFAFGAANTSNAVIANSQSISITQGNYSMVRILASSVGGNSYSQTFVVTYTDGTTATFSQNLSDWCYINNYSGESVVKTMAYRNKYDGTAQSLNCHVFGYTYTLDNSKTVSSITLPSSSKVRVLAITFVP